MASGDGAREPALPVQHREAGAGRNHREGVRGGRTVVDRVAEDPARRGVGFAMAATVWRAVPGGRDLREGRCGGFAHCGHTSPWDQVTQPVRSSTATVSVTHLGTEPGVGGELLGRRGLAAQRVEHAASVAVGRDPGRAAGVCPGSFPARRARRSTR